MIVVDLEDGLREEVEAEQADSDRSLTLMKLHRRGEVHDDVVQLERTDAQQRYDCPTGLEAPGDHVGSSVERLQTELLGHVAVERDDARARVEREIELSRADRRAHVDALALEVRGDVDVVDPGGNREQVAAEIGDLEFVVGDRPGCIRGDAGIECVLGVAVARTPMPRVRAAAQRPKVVVEGRRRRAALDVIHSDDAPRGAVDVPPLTIPLRIECLDDVPHDRSRDGANP